MEASESLARGAAEPASKRLRRRRARAMEAHRRHLADAEEVRQGPEHAAVEVPAARPISPLRPPRAHTHEPARQRRKDGVSAAAPSFRSRAKPARIVQSKSAHDATDRAQGLCTCRSSCLRAVCDQRYCLSLAHETNFRKA